jgi:MFS family permease
MMSYASDPEGGAGVLDAAEPRNYEIRVVAILCLAVALMAFEQAGIFYLLPFIQPELRLSNTQVGYLGTVYWVAYAASSYAMSALAQTLGKHKAILAVITVLMAICSAFSGCTSTFTMLILSRIFMGLLEGPIMPIAQSIVALESPVRRLGINTGIVGNFGCNILGLLVAPVAVVKLAQLYGWRAGFFVVLIPGVICGILMARFIREPTANDIVVHDGTVAAAKADSQGSLVEVLRFRNVWLCALITCFFVAYMTLGFQFLPLFYVNARQLSAQEMSLLMSVLGASAVLFGVVLPSISDRVGRKRVVVAAHVLSAACPLAALYYAGPLVGLATFMFVGSASQGAASIFTATIPSETVPARVISTAVGIIFALGVLVGGLLGPTIAGWGADRWGPQIPLLLQAACAIAAALVATALRETSRAPAP